MDGNRNGARLGGKSMCVKRVLRTAQTERTRAGMVGEGCESSDASEYVKTVGGTKSAKCVIG